MGRLERSQIGRNEPLKSLIPSDPMANHQAQKLQNCFAQSPLSPKARGVGLSVIDSRTGLLITILDRIFDVSVGLFSFSL
jgi:hypothetical protein